MTDKRIPLTIPADEGYKLGFALGVLMSHKPLGEFNEIVGNPLFDLEDMDAEMGRALEAKFLQEYNDAPDGDPTSVEEEFANAVNGIDAPLTKGDVLEWLERDLRAAFPRAYMKTFSRDDAVSLLKIMHTKGPWHLQICEGFSYDGETLAENWNRLNPEDTPITMDEIFVRRRAKRKDGQQ